MTENPSVHWDAETIGADVHPTQVSGVGAVRRVTGIGRGTGTELVHYIEVWDGAIDAGEPIGSAGVKPFTLTTETFIPHAAWTLTFTATSVSLNAVALAAPAPWGED